MQIPLDMTFSLVTKYWAYTTVNGAILEQNACFRPIYGSLRRSVMIDLGLFHEVF